MSVIDPCRPTTMKDIELTVTVRNNQLKERRLLSGLSQEDFSIKCGISLVAYARLECLRASPLDSDGQWKDVALLIADCHGVTPGELWPPETCAIRKPRSVRTMDAADMAKFAGACERPMLGPMEEVERSELREDVDRSFHLLSADEQKVINLRFGLNGHPVLTLEEVGGRLGRSKERIRQLEAHALWELRKSRRSPLRKYNVP